MRPRTGSEQGRGQRGEVDGGEVIGAVGDSVARVAQTCGVYVAGVAYPSSDRSRPQRYRPAQVDAVAAGPITAGRTDGREPARVR